MNATHMPNMPVTDTSGRASRQPLLGESWASHKPGDKAALRHSNIRAYLDGVKGMNMRPPVTFHYYFSHLYVYFLKNKSLRWRVRHVRVL